VTDGTPSAHNFYLAPRIVVVAKIKSLTNPSSNGIASNLGIGQNRRENTLIKSVRKRQDRFFIFHASIIARKNGSQAPIYGEWAGWGTVGWFDGAAVISSVYAPRDQCIGQPVGNMSGLAAVNLGQ